MKYLKKLTLATGLLLLLPAIAPATDSAPTRYQQMVDHYEAIRLALLGDSLLGVELHAGELKAKAADLRQNLSAEAAGIPAELLEKGAEALETIETSATRLTKVTDIESARKQFFDLTKPMAKYRKLAGDQSTFVAYCSMAQKAWMQPEGELGNPYMGQKMPKCGEVVSE